MEVKVKLFSINKLKLNTDVKIDPESGDRSVVGTVSFQVDDVNIPAFSRLVHLQKLSQPVDVEFMCEQAVMDFLVRSITDTGELIEPK